MSQSVDVLMVPHDMLPLCWDHAVPFLEKGLTAAVNVTLGDILVRLASGAETLWLVAENNELVAAFVAGTRTDRETGEKYLVLYGLGGEGAPRWASAIDKAMRTSAAHVGMCAIRFAGRPAWQRLLAGLEVKGHVGGHAIYERAVQ